MGGAGIERGGIAVDVHISHIPIVIVAIRAHAVPGVDGSLGVSWRRHQRVGREGDVSDRVGGIRDCERRHDSQRQSILQPFCMFQIPQPIPSRREPILRLFRGHSRRLRSPGEKRVKNVHGWLRLLDQPARKTFLNAAQNKKSRRERTPVCSLAPALALQNPPGLGRDVPSTRFPTHQDLVFRLSHRPWRAPARQRFPRQRILTRELSRRPA